MVSPSRETPYSANIINASSNDPHADVAFASFASAIHAIAWTEIEFRTCGYPHLSNVRMTDRWTHNPGKTQLAKYRHRKVSDSRLSPASYEIFQITSFDATRIANWFTNERRDTGHSFFVDVATDAPKQGEPYSKLTETTA